MHSGSIPFRERSAFPQPGGEKAQAGGVGKGTVRGLTRRDVIHARGSVCRVPDWAQLAFVSAPIIPKLVAAWRARGRRSIPRTCGRRPGRCGTRCCRRCAACVRRRSPIRWWSKVIYPVTVRSAAAPGPPAGARVGRRPTPGGGSAPGVVGRDVRRRASAVAGPRRRGGRPRCPTARGRPPAAGVPRWRRSASRRGSGCGTGTPSECCSGWAVRP